MRPAAALLLLPLLSPAPLPAAGDMLRGSVVKSDKWKMDRTNDLEIFDGNVSFRNPRYTMKADHALYTRPAQAWDIRGSVYMLRTFGDGSKLETSCSKALYLETEEEATLERGKLPVRMKYTGADSRVLSGTSDKALAEHSKGLITFDGGFSLSTENLDMYSDKALYRNSDGTFLMHEGQPAAIGMRRGYDFAIGAEKIKFFKESRDIKFYNKVSGWVKDVKDPGTEK